MTKKEKQYEESDVVVLLEQMQGGISVIAESQQQLQKDVTGLKKDMKHVKGELSEIKFKLDRKVSYDDFEKLEKRVLKLEHAS